MVNLTNTYNITQLKAADSLIDVAVYANQYSDGILFGAIPLGLFFIVLMLPNVPFSDKALGGSIAGFVISIGLASAGLLNPFFILVFLIIAAFAGFASYLFSKSGY